LKEKYEYKTVYDKAKVAIARYRYQVVGHWVGRAEEVWKQLVLFP
jgi:hypothetical protein